MCRSASATSESHVSQDFKMSGRGTSSIICSCTTIDPTLEARLVPQDRIFAVRSFSHGAGANIETIARPFRKAYTQFSLTGGTKLRRNSIHSSIFEDIENFHEEDDLT